MWCATEVLLMIQNLFAETYADKVAWLTGELGFHVVLRRGWQGTMVRRGFARL